MTEPVRLNVGGQLFVTSRATLEAHGDNLLTRMFDSRLPALRLDGALFVDRDPALFGHVLNLLRGCALPADVPLDALQQELDYYCIPPPRFEVEAKNEPLSLVERAALYVNRHPWPALRLDNHPVLAIGHAGQVVALDRSERGARALERVLASEQVEALLDALEQGRGNRIGLQARDFGPFTFWHTTTLLG